jgi:quercetin dioxygenase-like cupin family protein
MTFIIPRRRSVRRCFATAAALATAVLIAPVAASASTCPANKVVVNGQGQKINPAKAKGVTDAVLTRIDLKDEPVMLKEHALRLRRLVIQPGGIVSWHSHTDRPAIIYIVKGTVTEYRSTCAVPIVHRTGDSTGEVKGTSHWWKNTGGTAAVLLSADLFHDMDDAHVM